MADNFTDYLGLANVATTPPGTTPQYGLVYDLATARWTSAAEFRDFVRDVLPATQKDLLAEQKAKNDAKLHAQELREAQMHARIGVGVTPGEGDNRFELGLKGVGNLLGQGVSFLLGGPGQDLSPDDNEYANYSAHGGLLTKDEFMSFPAHTRVFLVNRAERNKLLSDTGETIMGVPGVETLAKAGRGLYRGAVAGVDIARTLNAPLVPGGSIDDEANDRRITDLLKGKTWQKAWDEADNESLGNALLDSALTPYVSQDTLTRWKRENSWYQLGSVGAEIATFWHTDPLVIGGKTIGAVGRIRRGDMPLNEASGLAKGMRQARQREQITVRNPATRAMINFRTNSYNKTLDELREYAQATTLSEFSDLPMFSARSRAVDGGAAAYVLHYAANNRTAINEAINAPRIHAGVEKAVDKNGDPVAVPDQLDIWDLTTQLTAGDPKAIAILDKMQQIAPDELREYAPHAGGLLEGVKALRTKHDLLQTEVDDLVKKAQELGEDTPSMFYKWEVHASLEDKVKRLEEASSMLHKYDDYQNWLDLLNQKANPRLSRVSGPTRSRWSEVRRRGPAEEVETHNVYKSGPFGLFHQVSRMPRGLFLQRANTGELHDLDSVLTSIDRQFDQFEHFFGYAPEGARDAYRLRALRAKTPFERYKVMYELEETHLVNGLAQKFGLETDTVKTILDRIHAERAESLNAILTGDGTVYRSAPSLMDRLTGQNTGIKLVEWDEKGDYATIRLMNSGSPQDFIVPKEALQPRHTPEDVTQTANYYTPLDTRRVYYEFKHNKDVLDELNAGILRHGKASMAEAAVWAGQKFNNLWKPAMLFRFAWPQRVLMDEGLRAAAMFGPTYWLTGPGADAALTGLRNILPNTIKYIDKKRHGKIGVSLGDGPVSAAAKRSPNPFKREAEVSEAVHVPESLWPKVDAKRATKINDQIAAWSAFEDTFEKSRQWAEHFRNRERRIESGDDQATMTELQRRLHAYGKAKQQEWSQQLSAKPASHPIVTISTDFDHVRTGRRLGASGEFSDEGLAGPVVYNPTNVKKRKSGNLPTETSGHIVPIPNIESVSSRAPLNEQMRWFNNNAEILSRTGMRIMADADGRFQIVRWFPNKERKRAEQFGMYVADRYPGVRMHDLSKGANGWREFRPSTDISPTYQTVSRYWMNQQRFELDEDGNLPIEGGEGIAAYHGASTPLPEDLLPRDVVEVANGRMMGKGLYSTLSRDIALSYPEGDPTKLYIIKDSKTNKKYKVWNGDEEITNDLLDDLVRWVEEQRDDRGNINGVYVDPQRLRDSAQGGSPYFRSTMQLNPTRKTWANLFEDLTGADKYQDLITNYLEQRHGVGAITHLGGTTHGHPHQVFVWFHPEDLLIKPAYQPTGQWDTLERWFLNGDSHDIPLPENRIVRTGLANPMVRELRTIAHRIDSEGETPELLQRERELMDGLGLRYRNENDPTLQPIMEGVEPRTYPFIRREDLSNPDTRRARPVSEQEFKRLAANGEAMIAAMKAQRTTPLALREELTSIKEDAWAATREDWGGVTIDTHSGNHVPANADQYALTIREPGQASVTVPANASREELDAAIDEAVDRFSEQFGRRHSHIGVFRDADTGKIEIDPVAVLDDLEDVEAIGAYTRATGGAYHFKSGNGYWPPFVPRNADEGKPREFLDDNLRTAKEPSGIQPSDASKFLPERYKLVDPGRFERMVDEARKIDRDRREAGELRAREVEAEDVGEMADFDFSIDSPFSWLMRKARERVEFGEKQFHVASADGESVLVNGPFTSHRGQLMRALTSSNRVLDVLTEGHGSGLSLARRRGTGYKVYNPPTFTENAIKKVRSREHKEAALYFQVLADTVNDHIGNSPVWNRMLRGESDEQIVRWLEDTPEGARYLDEVKPHSMPTEVWVDDHRFQLNRYVPSPELRRRLAKERLQPSDFRKKIADEDLPDIYGPDLELLDRRRNAGEFLSDIADRFYDVLGTKPIDALSRHPFYKAMYDMKMKGLVGSTNSKWLTEKKLLDFEREAQDFANMQVKRFLYNLTDSTNLTDALRFIAPFWGAQYEAITKWLNIIAERPETVGRYFLSQRALYNNFVVTDRDGNEVESGVRPGGLHHLGLYHPDDKVIFQLSDFVKKRVPGLESFAQVGIPIGSANTVLQGDLPLFPSLGPIATIPMDLFLKETSKTYGTEHAEDLWYRWFFPVGRPREQSNLMRVLDSVSPGWVRRVMQASDEDGQARLNLENQIYREMLTRAREKGLPEPSIEDAVKAADHLFKVRAVASYVLPFQTQFLPKHQYWVDAYHQYIKEYGQDAWDKFIDKYGEEAAIYATSSTNSIGVPPTVKGMSEWKANRKLIAKYPNWAQAIISPEAYMGDFNSDAYGQQLSIPLGPGTSETLRSGSNLEERLFEDPETRLGWREYRKISATIEAELFARGLTNIQQSAAADLVQIKRAAVAQLFEKYPRWARAYQQRSDEIYSDVEELKSIAYRPEFDKRPDWQGVRQYLEIREKYVSTLDQLGKMGLSRSLQSNQNAPIAAAFYDEVGQLVMENPAFAEFYSRYLDADDLSLGGGGF